MNLGDDMKKVILAGIGAMATTAEKTREFIDTLIEKGELTVEQGKIINEELKRNRGNRKKEAAAEDLEDLLNTLATLSKEEMDTLKGKLAEMEKKDDAQGNIG